MKDIKDYHLLQHNTFGIDARCRRFVEVESVDELRQFAAAYDAAAHGPLLIVGAGSNLLLTSDYPGTVLHVAIMGMDPTGEGSDILLRVGSGETWDDVVACAVAHGWHGAENLSLIPGEVGASAVQNIGAYGAEVKDIIHQVEVFELATGELRTLSCADCGYAYRYSHFKGEWAGRYVITHVTYRLQATFTPRLDYGNIRAELERQGIIQPTAMQLRDTIIGIRRAKLPDPAVLGNAGSFFMNPVVSQEQFQRLQALHAQIPHYPAAGGVKIPAAWLIDQCGWKGRTMGQAGVYQHQPLVLVNLGGATGADILRLCRAIQHDVRQQFGIDIHPEVNMI